jgi:hypothetical protein
MHPGSMSDPDQLPGMSARRSAGTRPRQPGSAAVTSAAAAGAAVGSGWGQAGLMVDEGAGEEDGEEELPDTPPDKQYRSTGLGLGFGS